MIALISLKTISATTAIPLLIPDVIDWVTASATLVLGIAASTTIVLISENIS